MKISASGILSIATLALVGGGFLYIRKWLKDNPGAFNPTSDKNLAYQGANKILQSVTGNKVDSVGTAVANVAPSSAEKKVNAMLTAPILSKNLSISVNPFDVAASTVVTDAVEPFLFGLGENTELGRFRFSAKARRSLRRNRNFVIRR